jgi:hypothetical protein
MSSFMFDVEARIGTTFSQITALDLRPTKSCFFVPP